MELRRVAVTGSSGFIGRALVPALENSGSVVYRLVRRPPQSKIEVFWNPAGDANDLRALEGLDALFHLAGENIASLRWTAKKKEKIRKSRICGTEKLVAALLQLATLPRVMVSASAVGYYGDRGDELLDESSAAGTGFLSEVATHWEHATEPLAKHGVRVINARMGLVLSRKGGALERMLLPFQLGLGGPLGSGEQFVSWITLRDALRAFEFSARIESLQGPVNFVAPHPVRFSDFATSLGKALHRPTVFRIPASLLHLVFGEMADALLLASTRATPSRLLQAGFTFEHPNIERALDWAIARG